MLTQDACNDKTVDCYTMQSFTISNCHNFQTATNKTPFRLPHENPIPQENSKGRVRPPELYETMTKKFRKRHLFGKL